jgi:glutathione peroxidase
VSVESFHDLQTTSLQGQPVDLARYRGSVVLAVNVASECGLTPQYEGLQALHSELESRGFAVLGFPSNDFGGQEPGTADQIQSFCERNYGVTFPMFAKLQTKAGPGQSPIYAFLTRGGQAPTWNFGKYLVGKDGKVIRFFPSDVTPDAKPLRDAIEQALAS